MQVTIQVDDVEVKGMLQRLAQRVGNLTPVMREAGRTLQNDAVNNFKRQSAPDGTPWKPLSYLTRLNRARKATGGKLYIKSGKRTTAKAYRAAISAQALLDTGVLRNSIQVQQVTPDSVTVGSRLKYAAIHQFGGQAGRGRKVNIPARPYIGMSDQARRDIVNAINRHLGTNQ